MSPLQNGFAERLIKSTLRECIDDVVVLGDEHLRRILRADAGYCNDIRMRRSSNKDAPAYRHVSGSGASNHTQSPADLIVVASGLGISVHTVVGI